MDNKTNTHGMSHIETEVFEFLKGKYGIMNSKKTVARAVEKYRRDKANFEFFQRRDVKKAA